MRASLAFCNQKPPVIRRFLLVAHAYLVGITTCGYGGINDVGFYPLVSCAGLTSLQCLIPLNTDKKRITGLLIPGLDPLIIMRQNMNLKVGGKERLQLGKTHSNHRVFVLPILML